MGRALRACDWSLVALPRGTGEVTSNRRPFRSALGLVWLAVSCKGGDSGTQSGKYNENVKLMCSGSEVTVAESSEDVAAK